MLDAMCWRFRAGTPWRDLPPEFGPWQTVWHRFNRWAADGTFDRIQRALQGDAHATGGLEWVVSVDSTVTRAHQHAAGARRVTGGSIESQESVARAG